MALPESHLGPLILVPARLPARSRAQNAWHRRLVVEPGVQDGLLADVRIEIEAWPIDYDEGGPRSLVRNREWSREESNPRPLVDGSKAVYTIFFAAGQVPR